MNPNGAFSPPLTLDEAIRLAVFMAERGHRGAAVDVLTNVAHAALALIPREDTP
jgi:hypothetical protein